MTNRHLVSIAKQAFIYRILMHHDSAVLLQNNNENNAVLFVLFTHRLLNFLTCLRRYFCLLSYQVLVHYNDNNSAVLLRRNNETRQNYLFCLPFTHPTLLNFLKMPTSLIFELVSSKESRGLIGSIALFTKFRPSYSLLIFPKFTKNSLDGSRTFISITLLLICLQNGLFIQKITRS